MLLILKVTQRFQPWLQQQNDNTVMIASQDPAFQSLLPKDWSSMEANQWTQRRQRFRTRRSNEFDSMFVSNSQHPIFDQGFFLLTD